MVYLDTEKLSFGHMVMSHMIADSPDELHDMAARIGIERRWFQGKSFPHYDVCQTKVTLALSCGARQLTRHDFVVQLRLIRARARRPEGAPR